MRERSNYAKEQGSLLGGDFIENASSTENSKRKSKGLCVKKKKMSNDDHACKILITCGHPSADGKLSVEMTYEGDPTLASYLLENAQGFIEQDDELYSA